MNDIYGKNDILKAVDKSNAIIEFDLDGNILSANTNFLSVMGYALDEIKGQHHSIFVEDKEKESTEYKEFWAYLRSGKFQSNEFKRIAKSGKEVWIEASYNPIFDRKGNPYKVVKFATDITKKKIEGALYAGQIHAINKSQAVIQFDMDGTIIDANANFLGVMGYSLEEIKGRHHSMFAEPEFAASQEYKNFWNDLNEGKFQSAQYKRIGKNGKEVWIEASYNPIFDTNGKPFRVIKFATDLTPRKDANRNLADDFESNVQSLVQILASSATQMQSTAQALSAAAEETSTQSNTVSSAAEELSMSVQEIAGQVANSVKIVTEAVDEAKTAENLVNGLVDAASKIGEVSSLISDIADQTNLLALNATIEAARAGDAGKGFAVVASEVKNLASETAKATEEITSQIQCIQDVSSTTAQAIKQIVGVISSVSEISTTISGAVEEQSACTAEVSTNISGVQTAANETGESSALMLNVSKELSERSEELQNRVSKFLESVRLM